MSKLIVDVDEKDLHSDFKKYCLNKGKTMKEVIINYMKRCVKNAGS